MTTRRIIFFVVFGIYQVFVLFTTIYIEAKKDDLSFLFDMIKRVSWFKYGAMFGLALLIIEFFWSKADAKKMNSDE